jgi:hypothetical protein
VKQKIRLFSAIRSEQKYKFVLLIPTKKREGLNGNERGSE